MSEKDDIAFINKLNWDRIKVEDDKVVVMPHTTEPYMYNNLHDDLLKLEIGDAVEVSFKDHRNVLEKYRGKKLLFVVNNYKDYEWCEPIRKLALVPKDKCTGFCKNDVLFIDDYRRFEYLMEDLFPCNRTPFRGWKNKEVRITKVV